MLALKICLVGNYNIRTYGKRMVEVKLDIDGSQDLNFRDYYWNSSTYNIMDDSIQNDMSLHYSLVAMGKRATLRPPSRRVILGSSPTFPINCTWFLKLLMIERIYAQIGRLKNNWTRYWKTEPHPQQQGKKGRRHWIYLWYLERLPFFDGFVLLPINGMCTISWFVVFDLLPVAPSLSPFFDAKWGTASLAVGAV